MTAGNRRCVVAAVFCLALGASAAAQSPAPAGASGPRAEGPPVKVYVPYENLKGVFETEGQGVFLPLVEFRRLWSAAQGAPAAVADAPLPYLISTARFSGHVGAELATLELELTVDVLTDDWVQAPLGLGQVAVAKAAFVAAGGDEDPKAGGADGGRPPAEASTPARSQPLLRVVDGQYLLVTKGKGRRVLKVEFACQLATRPGLNVLSFAIPPAAITTLELLIPEENMKVDVKPMLAATTTQVELEGKTKATKLLAFLGSATAVELSWKPTTQAAAELEPVVIADQFQVINVSEALISQEVKFVYDIRRRGVDSFTIQLPGDFRVTAVDGANISKWEVVSPGSQPATAPAAGAQTRPAALAVSAQILRVNLFSPVKDGYALSVKLERYLREAQVSIPLVPVLTQQALRVTGLIATAHSSGRSVELRDLKDLSRVEVGRLPAEARSLPGATAYRFVTSDYGGTLVIGTVEPRITVNYLWDLGVQTDRLELVGRLGYTVERAGVFELSFGLPEPWQIVSLGPSELVEDHTLSGQPAARKVNVLLRRELSGAFELQLVARTPRDKPDAPVDFALPQPDAKYLQLWGGQLVLHVPDALRAEIGQLRQLQSIPLAKASARQISGALTPMLAFDFRGVDRAQAAGATFKLAVKPTQVSAVVNRLVNIQPGYIDQEAVIQYNVLHAPTDTFYIQMPASLADAVPQITGANIKEQPRLDKQGSTGVPPVLPTTGGTPVLPATGGTPVLLAYYKIVLQSPVIGSYQLRVNLRQTFLAGKVGQVSDVKVEPILAAGKLSDQSGHIAIAKADTLAIAKPVSSGLIGGDPGSAADLPHEPHRRNAALAFKYNAPLFELTLPVVTQQEAEVFTTLASAAVIEQVLARDGTLNTHAIFLLSTSRGDRLPLVLPPGAKLFALMVDGAERPVETGAAPDEKVVRLPLSAGQVSRHVVEISYGLDKASAGKLSAPALPKEIPVQQTLWRLWVPEDRSVLWHDRDFAPLAGYQVDRMLAALAAGQPAPVTFRLPGQGKALDFLRQGPPRTLSVRLARAEYFAVGVWIVIILIGLALMRLRAFARVVTVLAIVLLGAILQLRWPDLVRQFLVQGRLALVLVAILWTVRWFLSWDRRRRGPAPPPPPSQTQPPESPAQPPATPLEGVGK